MWWFILDDMAFYMYVITVYHSTDLRLIIWLHFCIQKLWIHLLGKRQEQKWFHQSQCYLKDRRKNFQKLQHQKMELEIVLFLLHLLIPGYDYFVFLVDIYAYGNLFDGKLLFIVPYSISHVLLYNVSRSLMRMLLHLQSLQKLIWGVGLQRYPPQC